MVGYLKATAQITDTRDGQVFDMPLSWYPGMIGAFPVFDSEEAAKKFIGTERIEFWEVEITIPTIQ